LLLASSLAGKWVSVEEPRREGARPGLLVCAQLLGGEQELKGEGK